GGCRRTSRAIHGQYGHRPWGNLGFRARKGTHADTRKSRKVQVFPERYAAVEVLLFRPTVTINDRESGAEGEKTPASNGSPTATAFSRIQFVVRRTANLRVATRAELRSARTCSL